LASGVFGHLFLWIDRLLVRVFLSLAPEIIDIVVHLVAWVGFPPARVKTCAFPWLDTSISPEATRERDRISAAPRKLSLAFRSCFCY
jgi:hypothetical protein